MKVIPVIDIFDGSAVHAVKGKRHDYKPLMSVLCASSDPLDVAFAFKKLGFGELYVADLDSIMGRNSNLDTVKQMAEKTGLHLMVDAGVSDIKRAVQVIQHGASKLVIGTETLTRMGFVQDIVRLLGSDRVVVSYDMKNGKLLAKFSLSEFQNSISVLLNFQRMGLTQVILLDLAKVGSETGVDSTFLCQVLETTDLRVLVGGGVRNIDDLLKLSKMGVSGVLIATALHFGRITIEEIAKARIALS